MKFPAFLSLAIIAITFLFMDVKGSPTPDQGAHISTLGSDLPHPFAPLSMNHTVNGVKVTITGNDLHDIFAQLGHILLPEMTEVEIAAAEAEDMSARNTDSDAAIAKRNKAEIYCVPHPNFPTWRRAYVWSLKRIISMLNEIDEPGHVRARSCPRLSCFYGSAVYVCNDNYYDLWPNIKYLSSYAQDILDRCFWSDPPLSGEAGGQEMDRPDNYNVFVRNEACRPGRPTESDWPEFGPLP